VALAERHTHRLATVEQFPGFRDGRHDLVAREVHVNRLLGAHHPVEVLGVTGAGEATPPGAAVLARLAERLDDHRLFRHALLDGRQLAGLDQLGQHRRLAELRRPLRLRLDDRALDLPDQLRAEL
jgi:hypothetical protein